MLYFYFGTDREKARAAMNTAVKKFSKKGTRLVRISDANTVADVQAALQGGGMFEESRAVVFDGVCSNDEMRALVLQSLAVLKASADHYIIFEEKPDAATRKQIEKYAETSEKFDAVKQKDSSSIFSLANALRRGDKKALWVGYQRELASGKAPEAIHGVLFWGAKEMFLKSGAGAAKDRAGKLIATLAELPHESRRKGIELEYAIERFVLSEV